MKAFFRTIDFYISGKGNVKRLLRIWWFCLNVASLIIGLAANYIVSSYFRGLPYPSPNPVLDHLVSAFGIFISMLGFIIIFIYPFILLGSIYACRNSIKNKTLLFILTFFLVIPLQVIFSILYWLGAVLMLEYTS